MPCFIPPFQSIPKVSQIEYLCMKCYSYIIYMCVYKVTLYLSLSFTFHTLFHPQFECILIKQAKLGYLEMGHQFRRLAQSYYFLTKTIYILWIVKFKTKGETLVRINWGEETSLVPFFFSPCTLFFILTSYFVPSFKKTGASNQSL